MNRKKYRSCLGKTNKQMYFKRGGNDANAINGCGFSFERNKQFASYQKESHVNVLVQ